MQFLYHLFEDLNRLNWAHRLHQKFSFDDLKDLISIEQLNEGIIDGVEGTIYCFPPQEKDKATNRKIEISSSEAAEKLSQGCTIYCLDFLPPAACLLYTSDAADE